MEETIDDATGAALKAIQCIESTNRGVAVHPRSGDQTYPDFSFLAVPNVNGVQKNALWCLG